MLEDDIINRLGHAEPRDTTSKGYHVSLSHDRRGTIECCCTLHVSPSLQSVDLHSVQQG